MLNIVATYGRSLYALVIGLFCGRWTLMALGQTDYGLVGLVGGLTGFVSFLNNLLANAVGRFYAVNVGAAHKAGNEVSGLEECRKWFNTALSIHSVVPVFLVIIGYPVGVWAIEDFLTIPADRVEACIWVWRFTCVSCFVSMVNVPFQAMYTAKQEIAELTIYSFATTTLNACFLYYMITHPGFWMTKYMAWTCGLSIVPQLLIAFRAYVKYPECRLRLKYLWSVSRYIELAKYSFAKFWARFSSAFSSQGLSILVNKYMGPRFNASMSVANTVKGQALTLSASLQAAFWPVIANKAGEDDRAAVVRFGNLTCRIGSVLALIFALPLIIEMHEVLHLWLVNPPAFAAEICIVLLARDVIERMSDGYSTAIYCTGSGVMQYSWTAGWTGISTVFISWLFFALGWGMWSVVIGFSVSKLYLIIVRIHMARVLLGFSVRHWVVRIFSPIMLTAVLGAGFALIPRCLMPASFLRVCMTSLICEAVLLPAVWIVVLEKSERDFILSKLSATFSVAKRGLA